MSKTCPDTSQVSLSTVVTSFGASSLPLALCTVGVILARHCFRKTNWCNHQTIALFVLQPMRGNTSVEGQHCWKSQMIALLYHQWITNGLHALHW